MKITVMTCLAAERNMYIYAGQNMLVSDAGRDPDYI
jgi:hypothetical protein